MLAEQWRRHAETGDREVRDQLILAYAPIVKYVAGRIASRLPAHVDAADLISYGIDGLIDAVDHFDPGRGVTFEAYADRRIRGAIFDELRSLDWVPRAVRTEARDLQRATAELSMRLKRTPTDGELATELSIEPEHLRATMLRVAESHVIALDQPWSSASTDGVPTTVLETLLDPDAVDPAESADAAELRDRIGDALAHLDANERVILGLRYYQELSFSQIGEVLELSESHVYHIHAKALLHMGVLLPDEFAPAFG